LNAEIKLTLSVNALREILLRRLHQKGHFPHRSVLAPSGLHSIGAFELKLVNFSN